MPTNRRALRRPPRAQGERPAPRRRLSAAERVRGELVALRDEAVDARRDGVAALRDRERQSARTILDNLDLDFALRLRDKARFRANYLYKATGLGAVFRTIPTKVLTLDDLGTPDAVRSSPIGAPASCS